MATDTEASFKTQHNSTLVHVFKKYISIYVAAYCSALHGTYRYV